MKRGTTYPIMLELHGVDLTGAEWVIVSLKPNGLPVIEFTREKMSLSGDEEGTVIVVRLSEEQSVALDAQTVIVDCNWMMDGERGGAVLTSFNIGATLLTRVVE